MYNIIIQQFHISHTYITSCLSRQMRSLIPIIYFIFLFLIHLFLLVFNLSTYRIPPSAYPVKCPPQCPSPIHPYPPSTSPSTTPSSFPRVRSLHVLSPFLIFPTISSPFPSLPFSLLFIFPKRMRPYNVCPSPIDLFHSA